MRTSGIAVVLLVAAALMAPPAAADESLQASGLITYTWQGSPSLGCAAVGVCGVQGALIVDAQGGADAQELGRQTIINLGNSSATVRVITGNGQSASEGVDGAPNQGGESVFVTRAGGRLLGTIAPTLSSGRCAGPLAAELRGLTLAVRRSRGKHPSFDLRTSRTFTAGPFAGTLISTVTMRPGRPGFSSSSSSSSSGSFPGPPRRKVLVEHVSLRYRVSGFSEPLMISFSGESDPFCGVLDSCGAGGEVAVSAQDFSGTLTLQGSRPVAQRRDARQVIADLRRGRIALFGDLSSRLVTSESFVRADGSRCQDSATNLGALTVGGLSPTGKITVALSQTGSDVDMLRTHCPGPAYADVFGSTGQLAFARGPVGFTQLAKPHSQLTVTAPGGFSGLGYDGSRGGAIGFSLTLERVRAGTSEETR